ncbi:hypothetical protein DHEL01_v212363 [Diaporthe helianthi]|uniref:NADPH-dependent FMN reductase-like domain-containing protein n=1 Tax=Diaporthe helianthi TaxID=158607 RepID=A0A2P5HG62_DIAHE|nr:hypothetical protein DHEL01_v212363 [Diaporthe helianthi]
MGLDNKPVKVGIICGSTRSPRAGPQITDFVHETIKSHLASQPPPDGLSITLETVDIADFNLPLFDEPGIPQAITDPSGYAHQHTRDWSARIASLDAFIFVTPQYNWGIPAALKNAIDFLFNEWMRKPGMVVSYGGHGGGRAAEALAVVLQGLRMRTPGRTVNLSFPDREFSGKCLVGGDLGLQDEGSVVWARERDDIIAVWEDMVKLLLSSLGSS